MGIRVEDVHPAQARPDLPTLDASVELVEALGSGLMVYLKIDATQVRPAGADEGEDGSPEDDEGVVGIRAEPHRALPAAARPADRRNDSDRGGHRRPALLRQGDGCRASLAARSPLRRRSRSRLQAVPQSRRRMVRDPRRGRSLPCSRRASEGVGVRIATRVLRDDGSLPQRRDRRTIAGARPPASLSSDGLRPGQHTGYFHGGDFNGLTGTCDDPTTGLARIKALGFTALWVTPLAGRRGSRATVPPTTATGASPSTASTRTSAPSRLQGLRRLRAPARPEGLPLRRRQPHRRRDHPVRLGLRRAGGRPLPRLQREAVRRGTLRRRHDLPLPREEDSADPVRAAGRPHGKSPAWLNDPPCGTTTAGHRLLRAAHACYELGTSSVSTTCSPSSRPW